MNIQGFTTLSMLDYPGMVAATVFTKGCNLRCPFCHNGGIVLGKYDEIDEEEILAYLRKRKGILDGVAISGGEPLLQKDIADFIIKVKDLGYKVKLDTNGFMPERLSEIIDSGLVDHVAMDIKNSPEKYGMTVGIDSIDVTPFIKSAEILMSGKVSYEFRTTLVKEFHTENDLLAIGEWLCGAEKYYLQNFKKSDDILGDMPLSPFSESEVDRFVGILRPFFKKVEKR